MVRVIGELQTRRIKVKAREILHYSREHPNAIRMVSERSWSKQQTGISSLHREVERLQCYSQGELRIVRNYYWTSSYHLLTPLKHSNVKNSQVKINLFSPCRRDGNPRSQTLPETFNEKSKRRPTRKTNRRIA